MPKLDNIIAKASRDAENLRSHTLETAYAETVTKEIKEVAEELWPMIWEAIEKNKRLQEFRTGESKHVGLEVDGQWVLAGTPYLGSLSQNMLRKVKLDDGTIVQKVRCSATGQSLTLCAHTSLLTQWFLVFALMIALNKQIETEMKRYKESGSKDEPILSAEAIQRIGQPYNKDNKKQCWGSVVYAITESNAYVPASVNEMTNEGYNEAEEKNTSSLRELQKEHAEIHSLSVILYQCTVPDTHSPSLPLRASPVSLVLKSIEYSSQQITRRSRDEVNDIYPPRKEGIPAKNRASIINLNHYPI
jgi:hypothetical protein